jgi:hypothetical protein
MYNASYDCYYILQDDVAVWEVNMSSVQSL